MSRRRFFAIAGGAAAIGLAAYLKELQTAYYDPTLKVYLDHDGQLGYVETYPLFVRMENLFHGLPERKIPMTPDDIKNWAKEIAPMFSYNGLVPPNWQAVEKLVYYRDGLEYNHVLGNSDCQKEIEITDRVNNPVSPWYRDSEILFALVHEMAHTAQGELCENFADPVKIEASAQIIALEICASMANGKNKDMAYALIGELRSIVFGAVWGLAIKEGKEGAFIKLAETLSPDPFTKANLERAVRFWKGNTIYTASDVLTRYYLTPLQLIVNAIQKKDLLIRDTPIPTVQFDGRHFSSRLPPFKIDDLNYFLRHAEELAGAIKS